MPTDWREWHRAYDDPESPLSRRLAIVQRHIRSRLDAAPPGPIRVISFCAGEARDLLGALDGHPRRDDVRGRLVELDPVLAARTRERAPAAIEVVCGDTSNTDAYAGAVPADLVLVCGVFGNVSDADVRRTITTLPSLCAPGATVVWTRHRRPPDLTVTIRGWFAAVGFEELSFDGPADVVFGVGVHRFTGAPRPFAGGVTMFTFVGYDALRDRSAMERCDECGYDYGIYERNEFARVVREGAARWRGRLLSTDDATLRRRPASGVWSPLEYACHLRDVFTVQRGRIDLALAEDAPDFVPMRRDERAVEERYNEQSPADVARELVDAAGAFATRLETLDDAGWARTGIYNYPTSQVRAVEWIGRHTIHEIEHHLHDIEPA
jgi:hypothetical protein